jgi:diketogulonate reductase-like aldo/keto reductase
MLEKMCWASCLLVIFLCMGCTSAGTAVPEEGKEKTAMTVKVSPMVKLNSGYEMPVLGIGTWTLRGETAERAVETAIECGYRLIDTARYYGNEEAVGKGVKEAIRKGIVSREDLFITSKIMPGDYRRADAAIDDSLSALGVEYIDLMLIHQPGANDEEVYKALERGVRAGKIRSIGISNYYTPQDFERINRIAEITPAVVQNENHLYYQNTALKDYLSQYGTVVESWYPLGGRGNTRKVLSNKTIEEIAHKYGKTPAQIVLRWHIQAGYIVIPGSENSLHINENNDIYDFRLSEGEMAHIAELNKNERFENW